MLVLAGVLVAAAAGQSHAALKVIWPKNNSIVRESVNVAVDATNVPPDAYISFYLNNSFVAAVGSPSNLSGGRKAYTWVWDSRDPINLGRPNDAPKRPEDGLYDITVQAVGSDGKAVDRTLVRVRLANKVTSVSAAKPVSLKYDYRNGLRKKYAVRIGVTLAEVGGAAIKSTQEIQSTTYTGIASVEDLHSAALALMRYKPIDPKFTSFGKPQGMLTGFDAGSIYQLVDSHGLVKESDLFSTVGIRTSPSFAVDFRTPLPPKPVHEGESWSGEIGVSMPRLGGALDSDASLVLEGLEWAGGRECAKIGIKANTVTNIQLSLEDQTGAGTGGPQQATSSSAQIKGTGTDWFAFRTGELVRRELTLDVDTQMDQTMVSRLTEGLGLGSGTDTSSSSASSGRAPSDTGPGSEEMALANQYAKTASSFFRGGGASSGAAAQGSRVRLRIRVSAKLVN